MYYSVVSNISMETPLTVWENYNIPQSLVGQLHPLSHGLDDGGISVCACVGVRVKVRVRVRFTCARACVG